ncbi:MAG: hypothetical protein O0X93_06760 [Methanocorpusculum sp.]|nr:hypothetical protein [Methanocorpusculum sp.]MDE2523623.1 hypothetical protein [Methanocorpusculum sp.]
MTPSKKSSLLIFFAVIVIAVCCIAGLYLLYPGFTAAPVSTTASPTPTTSIAPDLTEVPFTIEGHTTLLPPQDTNSEDFIRTYGPVSIPDETKDIVYLTFDNPVTSFDGVIALDFTIYGEPYHRILKKTTFDLDPEIVTYEGRINTSDPATTFWITFGPGNLVHTDFPWQDSAIEVIPIQNRNFTESTDHPLHIAGRQPGWDERMQDPEFANDPWVQWINEERQKYADDPDYKPEYYWEFTLVNTFGMENDPGSTTVKFTEEDFQEVPEFREFITNPQAEIRLSEKIYDDAARERIYSKFSGPPGKRVFIEIDGRYYRLSSSPGVVTPWDP